MAPDGLSIRKIVRHVYNAHNSLFETVDLEEVKRSVTQYLVSRSKTPNSPIEHTGERGVYRLNPRSEESQELMLMFREHEDEPMEPSMQQQDTSLDLFADFFKET